MRSKAKLPAARHPASRTAFCRCKTAILRCAAAARGRISQFDEDYRWYAGDDTPNVPFYKDGREEPLRAEALTKAAYADIYTGDKVGDATVHDASFTESKTIDGFASWPMSFDVTVQMTGDTLDLQKVDGYKELTVQGEDGKPATLYGVDSSVDLTAYFQIKNTAGDDWKITAADYLEQGATELRLRISGTPFQVCDKLFSMTIRGRILAGGHDLAVAGGNEIYWDIRLMPSGELDYDNVRTAEEFVEAVGGADYAIADDISSWVLLKQDMYLPQDITMTGNFYDRSEWVQCWEHVGEARRRDDFALRKGRAEDHQQRLAVWRCDDAA